MPKCSHFEQLKIKKDKKSLNEKDNVTL